MQKSNSGSCCSEKGERIVTKPIQKRINTLIKSQDSLGVEYKKSQRTKEFKAQLRAKLVEQAKAYFGVPYSRKYHTNNCQLAQPDQKFLDCSGLVRQVVQDLQDDFGFTLASRNQAYQFDMLPGRLSLEELQPGDLVFTKGVYHSWANLKPQKHDIVHVEIFVGGDNGKSTIGSRAGKGVIKQFDSFEYESVKYKTIEYIFKSIEPWLDGVCQSICTEHPWEAILGLHPRKKTWVFDQIPRNPSLKRHLWLHAQKPVSTLAMELQRQCGDLLVCKSPSDILFFKERLYKRTVDPSLLLVDFFLTDFVDRFKQSFLENVISLLDTHSGSPLLIVANWDRTVFRKLILHAFASPWPQDSNPADMAIIGGMFRAACDSDESIPNGRRPRTSVLPGRGLLVVQEYRHFWQQVSDHKPLHKITICRNSRRVLEKLLCQRAKGKSADKYCPKGNWCVSIRPLQNSPLTLDGYKLDVKARLIIMQIDRELHCLLDKGVFRRALNRFDLSVPEKLATLTSIRRQKQSFKYKKHDENAVGSWEYYLGLFRDRARCTETISTSLSEDVAHLFRQLQNLVFGRLSSQLANSAILKGTLQQVHSRAQKAHLLFADVRKSVRRKVTELIDESILES